MYKHIVIVNIGDSDEERMKDFLEAVGIDRNQVIFRKGEPPVTTIKGSDEPWLNFEFSDDEDESKLWPEYLEKYCDWRKEHPHLPAELRVQARIENPLYLGPKGFKKVFLFLFQSPEKNFLLCYEPAKGSLLKRSFNFDELKRVDDKAFAAARLIKGILEHYCAEDKVIKGVGSSLPSESRRDYKLFIDDSAPRDLAISLRDLLTKLPASESEDRDRADIRIDGKTVESRTYRFGRGLEPPESKEGSKQVLIRVNPKHRKLEYQNDRGVGRREFKCPCNAIALIDALRLGMQKLEE